MIRSLLFSTITFAQLSMLYADSLLMRYVDFKKHYHKKSDFYQDKFVYEHLFKDGVMRISERDRVEIVNGFGGKLNNAKSHEEAIVILAKLIREPFLHAKGDKRRQRGELLSRDFNFKMTTSEFSKVGSAVLQAFGFHNRIVWMVTDGAVQHTFVEAYSKEKNRWVFLDFEMNVYFLDSTGSMCNFMESISDDGHCRPVRLSDDEVFPEFDFMNHSVKMFASLKDVDFLVVADSDSIFLDSIFSKSISTIKCLLGFGYRGYVLSLNGRQFPGGCN